jgi:hypothetical protein
VSEHVRPGGNHGIRRRILMRLMEKKWCPQWPRCCGQRLIFYQDKFLSGEDEEWTVAELATVETLIFSTLCCVKDNSPDPAMRRFATIQLLNPWWDRQRRGEEITEELIRNG